jgi:hypothetical protein
MKCEFCNDTGMRHVEEERQDQPAIVYYAPCICRSEDGEFDETPEE